MQDHTTVAPSTTTPKPTPKPHLAKNNFTVEDENHTVCIYMQAAFQISVTYENSKNKVGACLNWMSIVLKSVCFN